MLCVCVCVWAGGDWCRLSVLRCDEIDGIELVGFPPARARAIRDRLWARVGGLRGYRFVAEPAIAAGWSPGLDWVLEVLGRCAQVAETQIDPTGTPELRDGF